MDEWERKQHARIRRERALAERLDLRTRIVPSGKTFKRSPKYRPKDWHDWDALGD